MRRPHAGCSLTQHVAKTFLKSTHKLRPSYQRANEEWIAKTEAHSNTSTFRFGNFGTMMAVSESTAGGTAHHYDDGDDGMLLAHRDLCILLIRVAHYYSTIAVLGVGSYLQLPELGLKVRVEPGDVVCFLASQQLHRLTIDHDEGTPSPVQTVLTLWNDSKAISLAIPSAHTYPDLQPASSLG
jgi:hypothetical protein